jgi:O-antigen ligase
MRKWLVFSMFLVLFMDTTLGLKLGLGMGLSVKNLYLYALCMLLAVDAAMKPGDIKLADFDLQAPFLILLAYAGVTWVVKSTFDPVYEPMRSLVTLKNQLVDLYLFFLLFRFGPRTRDEFMWLLRGVVGVLAASSILTLVDFLDMPNLGIVGTFKGRVEGPIGAANQYGALLVFLLPVMISLIPRPGERWRLFWIITVLASAVLLVATGSRGAYVALISGSVMATLYLRRYLNPAAIMRGLLVGLVGTVVAVVIVMLTSEDVFFEVVRKTGEEDASRVSSGRLDIWTAAFRVMLEWPMSYVVGYGWNSYEASGIWKAAHSVYFDAWYELGLIGLLTLLWLYYRVVVRTRAHIAGAGPTEARVLKGYLFGFIGLLVAMVFVQIPEPSTIVWMITGLVVGLQSFSEPAAGTDPAVAGSPVALDGQSLGRASAG